MWCYKEVEFIDRIGLLIQNEQSIASICQAPRTLYRDLFEAQWVIVHYVSMYVYIYVQLVAERMRHWNRNWD